MATLDYNKRLQNLQSRRYDPELNESTISKAFNFSGISESWKYLIDSMQTVGKKYNDKTILAASRVQQHLVNGYQLPISIAFRTQGSVRTDTNIKTHSDYDLLTIIDDYHYLPIGQTPTNPYTRTDPNDDIKALRAQTIKILKSIYDEVDDAGDKSVSFVNKSLNRKVDVVPSFWYNSDNYQKNDSNEYYRGIQLYNFKTGNKLNVDFPFAHIHQVNAKGENTYDASRKGVRLLKNLKSDSDGKIVLSSFVLTTIVHKIESELLKQKYTNHLGIATLVLAQIQRILDDKTYRDSIESPNGTEFPLRNADLLPSINTLKEDLAQLILDCSKEGNSYAFGKALNEYQVWG